ncbi:MAG TPA: HPF/RaiA family ribosome-associated protein [Cellvibrionaceae bacterium]|nr:HPF/RaiA family ribosome-associated protein [Cellvibrionaceae bacterium]HMW46720.1 HPF/RaiA family ribosome-associated protein [Cellvibrionaceae bacterium]HMW71686.1 HPF/RaiA family ribosome-associated protein [Cellvibrionaceae bacterium]HMY37701.1 HPF/RaiA family ribosome-associated protein [Marinagarivorans sp.]HNG59665.1 HPF/RaiA family ribosome-associated protein [Cellvibrionaceae bacterium]
MRIDIHTGKFSLTDSLRSHVERRADYALGWAQQSLQQVIVRLDDLNGPKGGLDKLCRIQIPLVGGAVVVIAEVQADLYTAVDKAMERANQSLTRKLERKRKFQFRRFTAPLMDVPQSFTS